MVLTACIKYLSPSLTACLQRTTYSTAAEFQFSKETTKSCGNSESVDNFIMSLAMAEQCLSKSVRNLCTKFRKYLFQFDGTCIYKTWER